MNLVATQEERDLTAMLRELFAAHCPTTLVRELAEPGNDSALAPLWQALADAGVFGLALPEACGGSGGSLDELGLVYLEGGRALCPTLVYRTIEFGLVVHRLGTAEQHARLLPDVAAGRLRGTHALADPYDASDVSPKLTATQVDQPDGGWRLDGVLEFVSDADQADLIAVTASSGEHTIGLLVPTAAAGVAVTPTRLSGGGRFSRVTLDGVTVAAQDALAGSADSGLAAVDLQRLADTASALHALDMVGGADAVLARTVDYTRGREQFGRPIASFQAAQHIVADMHIAVQAARLAARSAVAHLDSGPARRRTAIAVMHAGTAYRRITLEAHQLHGGMGYVLETDLHLWSERARTGSVMGGGADTAAGWLQEEIGLG